MILCCNNDASRELACIYSSAGSLHPLPINKQIWNCIKKILGIQYLLAFSWLSCTTYFSLFICTVLDIVLCMMESRKLSIGLPHSISTLSMHLLWVRWFHQHMTPYLWCLQEWSSQLLYPLNHRYWCLPYHWHRSCTFEGPATCEVYMIVELIMLVSRSERMSSQYIPTCTLMPSTRLVTCKFSNHSCDNGLVYRCFWPSNHRGLYDAGSWRIEPSMWLIALQGQLWWKNCQAISLPRHNWQVWRLQLALQLRISSTPVHKTANET